MKTTYSRELLLCGIIALSAASMAVAAEPAGQEKDERAVSQRRLEVGNQDMGPDGSRPRDARPVPGQRERMRGMVPRGEFQGINQRIQDLQRRSWRLALSGEDHQDELKEMASQIGALESEKAMLRARALSEFGRGLTPDQREQFRKVMEAFTDTTMAFPAQPPMVGQGGADRFQDRPRVQQGEPFMPRPRIRATEPGRPVERPLDPAQPKEKELQEPQRDGSSALQAKEKHDSDRPLLKERDGDKEVKRDPVKRDQEKDER